jgi:hypothetical protein
MGQTIFDEIYPVAILEEIQRKIGPTALQGGTYYFLKGTGEGALIRQTEFRKYLEFGKIHGLLDAHMVSRLRSVYIETLLQARNELMAAWFFGTQAGFPVKPRPSGNRNSVGEVALTVQGCQDIYVEVKSPILEIPNQTWMGDDESTVRKNIRKAKKQIPIDGRPTLIVLAGRLRSAISAVEQNGIFKALYGEQLFTWPINNGGERVEAQPQWLHNGLFQPNFNKRISAVAVLDDIVSSPFLDNILFQREVNKNLPMNELHYSFQVLHNPYANWPIDGKVFGKWKQFVGKEDCSGMEWREGQKA